MSQTYEGGCHCGAVRYTVALDLSKVMSCNCSICSKSGVLLAFAPAGDFTLLSGEDQLADYQFNRNIIHHHFCRTCGVRSFARGTKADGSPVVAINARCLDGVDLDALEVHKVDGRSV